MHFNVYIPHPALQEFVTSILTINACLPEVGNEIIIPYPPTPIQSIIFHGEFPVKLKKEGDSLFQLKPSTVIVGPQYTRVNLLIQERLNIIRVDFHPCGLYRLLGIPMKYLFDNDFNAVDIIGRDIKKVIEKLVGISNDEKRKCIVENFLLQKVKDLKKSLPFDFAIRELMKKNGNITLDKIASLSCLGIRQFERICGERIGMPPKLFARIIRFSKAYRLKESFPAISWTSIAHEAGYFDQMHLIRDFKEFAGVTPHMMDEPLLSAPIQMQADLII
jgi:AraC-like DNA-binding protein